ncbi:MAG: exo-alpha-sialidase [Bacteroidetes bacterium]|nr:exo-alpha-sialidase [Bacteroidota bacterium]
MKKLFLIMPFILIGYFIFSGQKYGDEVKKWNNSRSTRISFDGQYSQLPRDNNYIFNNQTRTIRTSKETYTIFPNQLVHESFNTQSEVPITRHPTNPNIMFASANVFSGGNVINTGVYVTTNGGLSWFGSDTINNGSFNYGDPGPAIDKDGRFLMSFISLTGQISNSVSVDNGITWAPEIRIPGSSTSSDKNFSATDDVPSSPYYGRLYTVFTEFGGANVNKVVISYSTDQGQTWSAESPVSVGPYFQHFHQGADIRVGPEGQVYVIWANNLNTAVEDSLGFAKSTDGGVSWVVSRNNASDMNGIRNSGQNFFNGIRANGFPRIAVDRTNGLRRGWIYAATSEKFTAPATDVSDVILHRSTDGGNTWTKVRVNQDTPGNDKYQYMAAVNVDDNGGVNVIYYDNRNIPTNDSAQVYVSRSLDGGDSWTDILVSDHKFKPKSISGLAAGYQGDYIGITSGNNVLFPYWCDDITGLYQAWTARVDITSFPLNSFNLGTPAPGVTLVSYPNSTRNITISWDTSASTATYKWIFGTPTATVRTLTIPSLLNSFTITDGYLDNILSGLGVAVGDSLVGQWDVWAFRNNLNNDSLKAANGPRTITLKRGIPPLTSFNLNSPSNGASIFTSPTDVSNLNFNWSTSGPGVTYKWKFGSPVVSAVRIIRASNINGIDSAFSIPNNEMDGILASVGVLPGDSIIGQWSVYAYNGFDSVKAAQSNDLTFRRKAKGDILVIYDSTNANCRISRDSVMTNLERLSISYDTYNRKGVTSTDAITFREYKRVLLLGEGSSVMSNAIKDSLKSYLNAGTFQIKSKLLIISEDIGYQIDRPSSPYYDSAFARSMLGYQYVADRPGVGGRGIIGITINTNLTDSTSGPSPDVIKRSGSIPSNQTFNLYRYRLFADSMNAVGRLSPAYNVAVMAVDVESLRPVPDNPNPFTVKRILDGLIKFVDEIPTSNEPGFNTEIPYAYELSQNYPNPFNPATKISYSIPASNTVTLKIYNVLGKEVLTLVNERQDAGSYVVVLNASDLSSGIYFYTLSAGEFTDTKRMVLLK